MHITASRIIELLYALALVAPFVPRSVSHRRSTTGYAISKTRSLAEQEVKRDDEVQKCLVKAPKSLCRCARRRKPQYLEAVSSRSFPTSKSMKPNSRTSHSRQFEYTDAGIVFKWRCFWRLITAQPSLVSMTNSPKVLDRNSSTISL